MQQLFADFQVSEMRFELTQPFGHYPLKVACLPIPPPGQAFQTFVGNRAKNGTRTRDPDLGKVVLYQLSYFRVGLSGCFPFCDAKVDIIFIPAKFSAIFLRPIFLNSRHREFEAKVKISGDYKVRFDQAGMMIRIDHENYIKAGIEYVDGKMNLSTVVTHHTSDWSVIALDKAVDHIWIKAVRRKDAVEIFYSFDDKEYVMMRNAWMEANRPVKIGMMGACPDGEGFNVSFSDFTVKHLPDAIRTEWLEHNNQ